MNYVPPWIPFVKNPTSDIPTDVQDIETDTQHTDENQLSVSSTDSSLFEGADQISVSDVPSDQRKKNSFYRWFKRKLWCIRRSKSTDSNRIKNQTFRNAKIEIRKHADRKQPKEESQPATPVQVEQTEKPTGVKSVQPTPVNKQTNTSAQVEEVPAELKTPQVVPPKERQVTFSDTVKTHIKTKYVTAEEYQQIRGMDMNNRTILYQYNQSVEPKSCRLEEKNTFLRHKTDIRRGKQSNENALKT